MTIKRIFKFLTLSLSFVLTTPVFADNSAKWVQCVAFSPDGKRVGAGNDEGRLWVVEAATGKSVLECKGVVSVPTAVAWSRNGRSFAVGGWNGVVTVREAKTGKLLQTLKGHNTAVISVAISPDGRRAVSGSKGELNFWELK